MTDQRAAVRLYTDALVRGDDATASAVVGHLAEGVVAQSNFSRAEGREAVLESLENSMVTGYLAAAQWGETEVDGDTAHLVATLPEGMPLAGIDFVFAFNDAGEIQRVDQQIIPAPPPEATNLELTEDIEQAVDNALDNETPVLAAYVDDDGQPHVSFRGTTQVYSTDQLALWARDPGGGMARHIPRHPRVTLLYHDPKSRTTYTFYGRARVVEDDAARATIFESSNPREQNMDFRRKGVAVVIDLDTVEGRGPGGRVRMERKTPQ